MNQLTKTQIEGISFLLSRSKAILADDVGVGKSVQALTAAHSEGSYPLLIVCPNQLKHSVWLPEIQKWLPKLRVNEFSSAWTRKRRIRSLYDMEWDVLLVSPDQVRVHLNELAQHPFQAFIIDEAHKFRNPSALRTKSLFALSRTVDPKQVFLLTATPILNRSEEVWPLLHMCDPIKFRSRRKWCEAYLHEEYIPGCHYYISRFTNPKDPQAFQAMLGEYLLKRNREAGQVPEALPPQIIRLEMYPDQQKAYNQMLNDWWVHIDQDREVGVMNTLSQTIRLQQICTSLDILDDASLQCRGPKFDFVDDLVEGTNEQVYIIARSAVALQRYHKAHPDWACFTGQYGDADKELKAFQSGKKQVLMTTYQMGGEGHNLQMASIIIFLELDWVPANIHQAIGRLLRPGQKMMVQPYFLMTENSVDDVVYRTLQNKADIINVSIPPEELALLLLKDYNDQRRNTDSQ